ncbi:MAG: FKBP-type peptidyl-prolyl cis-trans isomerase [Gordonia sp. (in: high G+C Gram-positive bacteria)]
MTASALVGACGSDSGSSSSGSAAERPSNTAQSCPTAAPSATVAAGWTLAGATGKLSVIGSTATTAPKIAVTTPFSVAETQVHTLSAGTGEQVSASATVSVCYVGVDGRTGQVFDSSYERGAPESFPVSGVVAGFQKAIVGQRIGSSVGVAMTSDDGYPDGNPQAGINKGDTLVFELTILSAQE